MKLLLSESGFLADVTTSTLRSTMAYAAVAKARLKADEAQIHEAVLRTFGAMLKDRLASHGVGLAPTNQKRIAEKIQDYATIATLSSYFARNLVVDEP